MRVRVQPCWLLGLALTLLSGGCQREDIDRLSRVGKKAGHRIDRLTGEMRSHLLAGAQRAKPALGVQGLAGRVAPRLRWDRDLAGADLKVSSPRQGVIRLEGTVLGLSQQRRALTLTRSTLGVEEVEDQLTVSGTLPR
jgi:hypothetical protein